MGFVCRACGQGWDPGHFCQEMLDEVAAGANLARIRGEKSLAFDKGNFAVPEPDKSPSFADLLPVRDRPRGWRP